MSPLDDAPLAIPLAHTDVDVDGHCYRVILRDGKPVGVVVWVVEQFGPRAAHAYWRRVWTKGRRAPGRVVRVAIARAMAAVPEGRKCWPSINSQHDASHALFASIRLVDFVRRRVLPQARHIMQNDRGAVCLDPEIPQHCKSAGKAVRPAAQPPREQRLVEWQPELRRGRVRVNHQR